MVSLVLILVSGGMLVAGILRGADSLVIGSMVVSLLAAVALFVGIRRQRQALARRVVGSRTDEPTRPDTPTEVLPAVPVPEQAASVEQTAILTRLPTESEPHDDTMVLKAAAQKGRPTAAPPDLEHDAHLDEPLDDPPDEPPAEVLMASELSRVAELDNDVLVVDGRPRYHLADCPHLDGRSAQALPAAEAVDLGFTACGMCTAATTLLAQSARS